MKNKYLLSVLFFLINFSVFAENISIEAKKITLDKKRELSIFQDEVLITTQNKDTIRSDYAEYNNLTGVIKLRGNIIAIDTKNNKIESNLAEYNEKKGLFKSLGETSVKTTDGYSVKGKDVFFDNNIKNIKSDQRAVIIDQDNNNIYLDNFEYDSNTNIFKSIGYIKIEDKKNNSYEFSQIYIDAIKKELIGTDIKAFLNDESLKVNKENNPRIFANAIQLNKEKSVYEKSVFTLCKFRENDKCPPWTIQSKKMLHDNKKKTIYYDNAVVKVYDIPVLYFPKLSHPDPTVDRRSGFLVPSISNSKNLGSSLSVPYFFALNKDKNFTFTNRMFVDEHPLFLGEFHQAFKNSNLLADFGYTEGYNNTSSKKRAGDKSHFFTKFTKKLNFSNDSEGDLEINLQEVSNDKYLKLYKIESNLVDYNKDVLENSIDFSYTNDDSFLGIKSSIYETLNSSYEDKYEYILPELIFDKNLISSYSFGTLDFQSNFKVRTFETNKSTSFFVNDFNWISKDFVSKLGFKNNFLGNIKNINYEAKNVDLYKEETTTELFGSVGYLSELDLRKINGDTSYLFKPKVLFRYSPGSMRKETDGQRLDSANAFSLNRLSNINNNENGLSSSVGFDYKIKEATKEFNFSVAQIISARENKKMSSRSSLDEKVSDLVGSANYLVNNRVDLKYNFAIDQNYKELNYSEIGTILNLDPIKADFSYLQEDKHLGDQEYFKTKLEYNKNKNSILSFETKRNLVTDSAEFYNLSYEYLNDCLRAGLVYRREFYKDSEIEPENSLMFKITLTPFGNINSPTFNQ